MKHQIILNLDKDHYDLFQLVKDNIGCSNSSLSNRILELSLKFVENEEIDRYVKNSNFSKLTTAQCKEIYNNFIYNGGLDDGYYKQLRDRYSRFSTQNQFLANFYRYCSLIVTIMLDYHKNRILDFNER